MKIAVLDGYCLNPGDLSWDAFEPSEGQFEFAWFDQILEQMDQAGIKVILDIGGSPAPIWLHHKYPSVNMVNEHRATVQPAERYMDDISDPAYREHLIRFAVLPGLTGLWQVESRADPSFANYIALDTRYVQNWSLWLDMKILFRTPGVVLRGTGC